MELKESLSMTLCLAICISVGCARAQMRIANGRIAQPRRFPHQVSLQMNNYHWCGGSILDATHILTAAHCMIDEKTLRIFPANKIRVITGVNDNEARNNSNTFRVSRIIPHYLFDPDHIANDIAILKLARSITFNSFQKRIRLPRRDIPSGTPVTASGWGDVDNNRKRTRYLRQLAMITVSLDECRDAYGTDITHKHICVRHVPDTGMCFGDSGGPLTYHNEVVGITSYAVTNDLCADNWPDVFTRVYSHIPWIKDVIRLTS